MRRRYRPTYGLQLTFLNPTTDPNTMNDTPNFQSILDEAPTEVLVPPPMPVGTYLCIVSGYEYGESNQKKTPFVQFQLRPVAASEDVDEEELAEIGGLDGKTLRTTYYLTEDAAYRLDEFHEHCGVNLSEAAKRSSRNDMVINAEVMAVVKHGQSKDGSRTFAEVARTLPAN